MARKWSNQNLPGALHFVTGNLINRTQFFTDDVTCDAFFKVCKDLKAEWPAKFIAYVLMPDHFHLIVNPRDGNIQGFNGALKSLSAREAIKLCSDNRFLRTTPDVDGSIHQVWQESFKAQPLWSGWMIWQKIHYIHGNPVKARLVTSTKDYPWSSFRAFYDDSQEPLPIDKDWWWPDDSEKLSRAVKELGWRAYHKRDKRDAKKSGGEPPFPTCEVD
ncbi:MAG TPA: transposase [Pyrinomonadaceae bacterium]